MKKITVSELLDLQKKGRPDFAVLDVRERWEYSDGHIPHSSPLPRGSLECRIFEMIPDSQTEIIIYSSQEGRSSLAAETLLSLGFSHTAVLEGGFTAWKSVGECVPGWSVDGKHLGEVIVKEFDNLSVKAPQLAELLKQKRVKIIDIRTAWEHQQGYIPHAEHIPAGELFEQGERLKAGLKNGDYDCIVTHCSGRTRGIAGAAVLRSMGIDQAYALENGCMGWILAGQQMEFDQTPAYQEKNQAAPAWEDPDSALISPEELARKKEQEKFYLVDVRMEGEFLNGHIAGSLSIPAGQMMLEFENYLAIRGLPVVVVARNAPQAAWAADTLRRVGFPVHILRGGFNGWVNAGYNVCKATGNPAADNPVIASLKELEIPMVEASPASLAIPANVPANIPAAASVTAPANMPAMSATLPANTLVNVSADLFIDVRSLGEWAIEHIDGSKPIPRGTLEAKLQGSAPSGSASESCMLVQAERIVLVSETGIRAALAWKKFHQHPRTAGKLFVLKGGMAAWKAAGLPTSEGNLPASISTHDTVAKVTRRVWNQPAGNSEAMQEYLDWEEKLTEKKVQ